MNPDVRMAQEFLSAFAELAQELPGAEIGWIRELREQALDALSRPESFARGWEEDEFAGLSLEAATFRPAAFGARGWLGPEELSPALVRAVEAGSLVSLDGCFSQALTSARADQEGLELSNLSEALAFAREELRDHLGRQLCGPQTPFVPLNTAFMSDGAVLRVRAGVSVPKPIQLLFVSSGPAGALATHPRVLIVLEPGSRATVTQSFLGLEDRVYLTNAVCEAVVEEGAALELVLLAAESDAAFHNWTGAAELGPGARLSLRTFALGGAVSRIEQQVTLAGAGASARLQTFVHAAGEAHLAFASRTLHGAPETASSQKVRAWVDDAATATLRPASALGSAAAKATADSEISGVLASADASIRVLPELAASGSGGSRDRVAVQPLDPAAVTVYEASGLTARQARSRLALAIADEIASGVSSREVAASLLATLEERLSRFRAWSP